MLNHFHTPAGEANVRAADITLDAALTSFDNQLKVFYRSGSNPPPANGK